MICSIDGKVASIKIQNCLTIVLCMLILISCASVKQNDTVVARTQSVIGSPKLSAEATDGVSTVDKPEIDLKMMALLTVVSLLSAGVLGVATTPIIFILPSSILSSAVLSNRSYEKTIEQFARDCVAIYLKKYYEDKKYFSIILKEGELQFTVISNSGDILGGEANWEKFHMRITFNLKSDVVKLDYTLDGYYASGFKEHDPPKKFRPFGEEHLLKLQNYVDKVASDVERNFDAQTTSYDKYIKAEKHAE